MIDPVDTYHRLMDEIKIVNIEAKPWWKLWTTDNLQVTVEDGQGNQKTFTVHHRFDVPIVLLKKHIAEKYCTGDQFWCLHQREKHEKTLKKVKKTKTKEISYAKTMFNQSLRLVGESFDCVLILPKEAVD